jgi:hypothetical protein
VLFHGFFLLFNKTGSGLNPFNLPIPALQADDPVICPAEGAGKNGLTEGAGCLVSMA